MDELAALVPFRIDGVHYLLSRFFRVGSVRETVTVTQLRDDGCIRREGSWGIFTGEDQDFTSVLDRFNLLPHHGGDTACFQVVMNERDFHKYNVSEACLNCPLFLGERVIQIR